MVLHCGATIKNCDKYLQATNMRIAVPVIFPGDLLQHPVTPVQKAAKTEMKEIMKRAIIERPISGKKCEILKMCYSVGLFNTYAVLSKHRR